MRRLTTADAGFEAAFAALLDEGSVEFLERSLADLDAELAAGDLSAADHARLRDGYTARLARALRGEDPDPTPPPVGPARSPWPRRLKLARDRVGRVGGKLLRDDRAQDRREPVLAPPQRQRADFRQDSRPDRIGGGQMRQPFLHVGIRVDHPQRGQPRHCRSCSTVAAQSRAPCRSRVS